MGYADDRREIGGSASPSQLNSLHSPMLRTALPKALAATGLIAALMFGVNHLSDASPEILAPESLPSPAGAGSAEPNLTVGPNGKVHLSWLEPVDSGFALRFATLDRTSWSAPQ